MSTLSEIPVAPAAETVRFDAEYLNQYRSTRMNVIFGVTLAIFHLGAIAALFFFSWKALAAFIVLWIIGENVGIGMSYHRLLTHRGYTTPRWVEYALTICGTLALQGGPIYWVAVHRMHHQLTDRPGDPHSPRDGAWWSHIGWILNGSLHNHHPVLARYTPDLANDRFYVWLSRWHWIPLTVVGAVLFFIGGWPCFLWGIFLRITLGLHATWLVNSATHMWGARRFPTRDDSRNNWWVAIITGGEGWHNNHHAHPVSASHGMAWYELDINYWGIRLLGLVGLARRIKVQGAGGGPARVLYP
jgi:fatty-acid desaturase